jgi:hypothetical protein
MAGNFRNFVSQADEKPPISYETLTHTLWATGGEIDASHTEPENLDHLNPAQKFIEYSKQYASLTGRIDSARIENDPSGKGLTNLIAEFSPQQPKPKSMAVALPQALVDKYGGDVSQLSFGAIKIKDEAHLKTLQEQVKIAGNHLENIELHVVKDKKGNDVAVVMNAEAGHFNAVIAAYNKQASLGQAAQQAQKEMTPVARAPEQTATLDMEKMAKLAASLPKIKEHDPNVIKAPPSIAAQGFEPNKGRGGIAG